MKKIGKYFFVGFYVLIIIILIGTTFYSSNYLANNKIENTFKHLLKAQEITGSTYYTDGNNKGGNDCNDSWAGTLSQPFCTIAKGISKLTPGDTLYVRGGNYPSFDNGNKSGTVGGYITISGYNNEMPIVNGGIGIRLWNASYIKIKGFEVTGATGNWSGGITLDNSNNNIVESNKTHDNIASGISGIKVYNSSSNKVLNNESFRNNGSGISVTGNSTDNDVGFNKL